MSDEFDVVDVIWKNGKEYLLAKDGRLFKAGTGEGYDKFIGWLDANKKYTPSPDILKKREKIEEEAKRRLREEKEAKKKALFELAVRRRMDELRHS